MDKLRISKKAIIAAIAGAVVGLIFNALIGSLLPIIIGAALGLLIGLFVFPASGKKPKIEIVDTADPVDRYLEQILAMNKKLRLDPYLKKEVLDKFESIADKLGNIVPKANREHPGSELTYVVNRMVTNYLPELLDPYLALSPDAREGEITTLMATLNSLETEIDSIIKLIEERKVNEFRVQDTFLRHKFTEKGVEA